MSDIGRLDPILNIAFAMHNNPGVYALLLGSGVSRAAGIPTGWEIVLDLIRRVARLLGDDPGADPETWYQRRFEKSPDYAELLEQLGGTPTERMTLLHSYFEPTEEEQEQGLKTPTATHRAVANLVKLGYVRMILTTNFDRLLEKAFHEQGITPDVISSDDDLKGAIPYVHSRCYLVKLHGDYRDSRIRNTPEELANYSKALNRFLDRVLDEFGLIICGWSGAWDTALRNAILRCPNRRFSTYWLAKGEVTEEAQRIINQRRAVIVGIQSADQFFKELCEKVEALRELGSPHPLSTAAAVATVKRYVVEPRHRVRLRDLIREETEKVYQELNADRFTSQAEPNPELFRQPLHQYEAVVEQLMAMLAALSYYDTGENAFLLTECIERLIPAVQSVRVVSAPKLRYYPALLLVYATGISALAAKRFRNLAAVLREPRYRDTARDEKRPAIQSVNVYLVFGDANRWVPRPNAAREYTPASNYLHDVLRHILREYLPDDNRYSEIFDVFEYLLALNYIDLVEGSWSPIGRFGWRYNECFREANEEKWKRSPLGEFIHAGLEQGGDWELMRAGFFQGSPERLREIIGEHKDYVRRVTQSWG